MQFNWVHAVGTVLIFPHILQIECMADEDMTIFTCVNRNCTESFLLPYII